MARIRIPRRPKSEKLFAAASRILPGGVRELVHEAFEKDRVLVDVHAAPEPRRDVRVAHGVVDEEIGHGVADREVAGLVQALEGQGVHAVLEILREHARQDRLPRQAQVQADEIAGRVEPARQLRLESAGGLFEDHLRSVQAGEVGLHLHVEPQQFHAPNGFLHVVALPRFSLQGRNMQAF